MTIETLDVSDQIISKSRKLRLKENLKSSSNVHKKAPEVEREIQERFRNFLIEARRAKNEPIQSFDPMGALVDDSDIEPP